MIKKLFALFMMVWSVTAIAADVPPAPVPVQRISIFSTTTDWAALTGLPLRQFIGDFSWTNADVARGMVLYYLDAFPCYGEADSVRVWLSPNGKMVGNLRIVCVHKPETISFAYRNATEEALDGRSIGLLTCPITGDRHFKIDISKCIRGKDWTEYR